MVEKSRKYLEINSSTDKLEKVANFTEKFGQSAGLIEDKIDDLTISVTEAVNNAIKHGNALDEERKVRIEYIDDDRYVEVQIQDEGAGFDPDEIRDPRDPENILRDSGRGLLIIKTLVDYFEVTSNKAGTKIVFRLNKPR